MTTHLVVPDWLAVVTLLALVVLAAAVLGLQRSLRRSRQQTEALLDAAASDADALREQLAGLEVRLRTQPTAV